MQFYVKSTIYDGNGVVDLYPWLRDYGYENNHITVTTLEELMDVVKKSGDDNGVILFTSRIGIVDGKYQYIQEPTIEIYDGYRE